MRLEVEREDDAGGLRLCIRGDVDMTTGERLEAEIVAAERDEPGTLTLDFSGVAFFDSTGLQILLDADVRAREAGRRLIIVPGDGEVARVLALTDVADRLQVAVLE